MVKFLKRNLYDPNVICIKYEITAQFFWIISKHSKTTFYFDQINLFFFKPMTFVPFIEVRLLSILNGVHSARSEK